MLLCSVQRASTSNSCLSGPAAAAAACRSQVPEKYRKKIELMVRKPDKGEEPSEGLVPCPFCQLPGPESQLQCESCQNTIQFDIATGAGSSLLLCLKHGVELRQVAAVPLLAVSLLIVAVDAAAEPIGPTAVLLPAIVRTCHGLHSSELFELCCIMDAGKRMALYDWCECPSCHMPCSSQAFLAILSAEGRCPMCSREVSMQDVRPVKDPLNRAAYHSGEAVSTADQGGVALPPSS